MAGINDLGRLIANAVKAGLQETGGSAPGTAVVNSSNSVMARPVFSNLAQNDGGGVVPPYGAQNVNNPPYQGGSVVNSRPAFNGAVAAISGTIAMMPGAAQANFVNYANTRIANQFAPGSQGQAPNMPGFGDNAAFTGQYNAASQMVRQIAQNSTVTNSMDVYSAFQQLSAKNNFGIMGDVNATRFIAGAGALSNLTPGMGVEKSATSLYGAFSAPRTQNYARMMGMSLTGSDGALKDPRQIVDMIYNRLNQGKEGSRAISKEDIQRSLLPGKSIDSLLNQIVGDDPAARHQIATALIAKAAAGGGSAYELTTKDKALEMGFTTEGMLSASNRSAAEMGKIQSVARAETYGLGKANEAATILAETLTRLNNLLGLATPGAVVAGLLDGTRAEGGSVGASNAYLVGEMGPELFVPNSSGYVVPNDQVRLAGARHEGGYVHPHGHPEWSKSDMDSDGKMSSAKIKELLGYVGFQGSQVGDAMKIIGKESARRPKALNPDANTGDLSYGLFQINMLGDLGPDRRKKFNLPNNDALYDPLKNAEVAYAMSNQGTNWNAWSTAAGLGLSTKSVSGNRMYADGQDSGSGLFDGVKSFMTGAARGLNGLGAGTNIYYGGVKVDVILPKGSSADGKTIARDMNKSLQEDNIAKKARTQ